MFRCKRDVDRHVADLEEKVPSVAERSLKYFTVARLYFNVGEDKLALKFLDKYCDVRPSSAPAFKFRGQVLEKAAEREQSQESSQAKKTAALEAFQSSYQLDLSQKELLLKVCELLLQFPIADIERTRCVIMLSPPKAFNHYLFYFVYITGTGLSKVKSNFQETN